jgi:predicted MFS family arabinose efflux permease
MLAPLKRSTFRTLWAGMGLSYAGDRLQELAQGWLVATLTGSALAVGGIGMLSSIPMLLMPLGGVIADQTDRRRLLLAGQWAGALITGVMAVLAFSNRIVAWHIYVWAFISGVVWMVIRPAYKVIVTEAVPPEEVRPAVSLNSVTETTALVLMNTAGSALIGWLGLPVAFVLNSASYVIAILCLGRLRGLGRPAIKMPGHGSTTRVFTDLKDGLVYLVRHKDLLFPLLLTLLVITVASPATSLLAAIVHEGGGSIVQLGMLGGAASLGALTGAIFAGMKGEGNPLRTYSFFALLAAVAVMVFAFKPIGISGGLALFSLGFLAFSQAVWNTSRVPRLAEPEYQARIQSVTSMAFTLGTPLGALWGGLAVDHFGIPALMIGAGVLVLISLTILIGCHNLSR